jgi:hypothetical protein
MGGTGGAENAPACATDYVPFMRIEVIGVERAKGPRSVRVVELGVGLPPGVPEHLRGAFTDDQLGWLRVAELGCDEGDAGAVNAGETGARDAGAREECAQWVILGPRPLGELPVSIGDELLLTFEAFGLIDYFSRVVLQQDEDVLLFHQDTNYSDLFGTFSGITLERGDVLCVAPYTSSEPAQHCADIYEHELLVTLPGGASATLARGAEQTVGGFRVLHGSTTRVNRFLPITSNDTACSDLASESSQVTVVRSSSQQ